MAEGRRGLGRGLSALMDDGEAATAVSAEVRAASGVESLPIEMVLRNPGQPRTQFSEEQMAELTASVAERGVLQPILVRPLEGQPGHYQIVAGERRWLASQRAGLKDIPAIIRDFNDMQVMEIALIENIQRADLNAMEEARGYQALMTRFQRTQEALADIVGKSRSHVANTLRLLNAPLKIQSLLEEGRLTAGHVRALIGAPNALELAGRVIDGHLSVRQTEALARQGPSGAARRPRRNGGGQDTDTLALEADLSEVLGLEVSIRDQGGAGEVRLRYETLEQLDDLCRRLMKAAR